MSGWMMPASIVLKVKQGGTGPPASVCYTQTFVAGSLGGDLTMHSGAALSLDHCPQGAWNAPALLYLWKEHGLGQERPRMIGPRNSLAGRWGQASALGLLYPIFPDWKILLQDAV